MTPFLLALPLVVAAPVPKDFKKVTPVLEGAWQCTGVDINGRMIARQNQTWRFEGDSLVIENAGGGRQQPIPIKTDPKTTPMEFEFVNNGNQLGIYEIKDDALTICVSQQQGVRPADAASGPRVIRYLLTRSKDK
jgi:uncharacterized protein (TIGR03067 family)